MRKTAIAAAVLALAAGCSTAPSAHIIGAAKPGPSAAPTVSTCSAGAWAIQNSPSGMQQTLAGDVQQIRTHLRARNPAAVADDGYRLAQEVIADQSPQSPACAPVLRHAWRQMVLWYGLAGLALYITKARPDLRAHGYSLGDRDIKRAEHWSNVAAEQMSAGG